MGMTNRWLWAMTAVLFLGLVGVSAYAASLQRALSSNISQLDTKFAGEMNALDQDLSLRLDRSVASLAADLNAQGDRLTARADTLAEQLETLDAALGKEIADIALELRGSLQNVKTGLDTVRAELKAADAALGAQVELQGSEVRGSLEGVATSLGGLSTALEGLEGETDRLLALASRALLDVPTLYDAVKGSVVEVLLAGELFGSGFIYGPQANYVVTAWHVVRAGGAISVRTAGGAVVNATLAGSKPAEDVAILRLSNFVDLQPLPLGDSSQLMIGQGVIVVGSPNELTASVTRGIISGLGRAGKFTGTACEDCSDLVQWDAATAGGSSGGPIFNDKGEVISIVSLGSNSGDIGLGPSSNSIKSFVDSIASA